MNNTSKHNQAIATIIALIAFLFGVFVFCYENWIELTNFMTFKATNDALNSENNNRFSGPINSKMDAISLTNNFVFATLPDYETLQNVPNISNAVLIEINKVLLHNNMKTTERKNIEMIIEELEFTARGLSNESRSNLLRRIADASHLVIFSVDFDSSERSINSYNLEIVQKSLTSSVSLNVSDLTGANLCISQKSSTIYREDNKFQTSGPLKYSLEEAVNLAKAAIQEILEECYIFK